MLKSFGFMLKCFGLILKCFGRMLKCFGRMKSFSELESSRPFWTLVILVYVVLLLTFIEDTNERNRVLMGI